MFHNKKLRIALIVIVLLTGFLALASNTVQVRENPTFLEKGLRIAASPFQSSFHAIHNGIDGIGSYFADKKALEAENKKLREQVDALHHQVARLEETQLENIRLKELLDYKEGMDKAYQLQLAETIAKKNNNLQYMITINKGSEDGVTAGMTVMNHYGLIGRVSSVLSGSAEVLLLPDHESAVGARVKSTREALGVVEGDGTSTGNLQMIHLQHDADIFVGDEVITSGLDGVFPADIPIGEVTAIQYDA
ncbi:MAG: rod shape-determining protein MreC, partial [Peptococcaceae bacterium]|nr:rod shape-determining protein MreC [Peptococcaceae bacterium]